MAENKKQGALQSMISYIFYSFLKYYNGINWKHREFQTPLEITTQKNWVEPEIVYLNFSNTRLSAHILSTDYLICSTLSYSVEQPEQACLSHKTVVQPC